MKRVLGLCAVVLFSGCYDFRKDLFDCVRAGQCAVDAGPGAGPSDDAGTTAFDAGALPSDGGATPGFLHDICSTSQWCWQTPFPKNELNGSAPLAADDFWVFGSLGAVMHFDGTTWARVPHASVEFRQVVITGAHEFYVASSAGVWRYDGTSLSLVPGSTTFGAWALTVVGTHIWALQSRDKSRVLMHFDGSTWSQVNAPIEVGAPYLLAAWGSAPNDVWFAGQQGDALHWDGANFTASALPTDGADVSALGGFGTTLFAGDSNGKIYSYQSGTWSNAYTMPGYVAAISAGAANNVWFSGQYGNTAHWDGSALQGSSSVASCEASTVNVGPGGLTAVVDRCGDVYRRTDASWAPLFDNGFTQIYRAVHGSSASDLWVGGDSGTLTHFDGAKWTTSALSGNAIYGLWALTPTSVFAVEGSDNLNVPTQMYHWDGSSWQPAASAEQGFQAVWASSTGSAWGVGLKGTIVRATPSGQSFVSAPQTSTVTSTLRAVGGSSETDVWAVGDNGVILHSTDGSTWAPVASPTTASILSLWVDPTTTSNAWATTFDHTLHWDGSTWQLKPLSDSQTRVITGAGSELLTCDISGQIGRGTASGLALEQSGTANWLRSAWDGPGGHPSVVVGDRGTILVRQ